MVGVCPPNDMMAILGYLQLLKEEKYATRNLQRE
jgi:hypothetical protein